MDTQFNKQNDKASAPNKTPVEQADIENRKLDEEEDVGTPDEAMMAARRMAAGPELNNHGTVAYHPREETGRRAPPESKP